MSCNDNEISSLYTRGLVSTLKSVFTRYIRVISVSFKANLFVALMYQLHLVAWVDVAFLVTVSNFKELFRQSYHTKPALLLCLIKHK
jgi:hypothetical protein